MQQIEWDYDQQVKIISGKYAGEEGLLKQCREESKHNMRAEVEISTGRIWCDLGDLEYYDANNENLIDILLMLPEEEHAEFHQRVKDYEEGESC
jgi:hypothetical protein